VTQESLRDQAYVILRDAIVSGSLAPGLQLRDQDLASQMGLSRTPVREALQRLADEGLVSVSPRARTEVSALESRAARDAFVVVAALHALAARLAQPRWTKADGEALRQANLTLADALDRGDPPAAIAADDAFHGVFVARADNRELARALASITPKVRRLEWLQFSSLRGRGSVRQHDAIIEAAGGGVGDLAGLVEENWLSLGRLVVESLDQA
jgi:DNA-binding GntR family transcriptional regulator